MPLVSLLHERSLWILLFRLLFLSHTHLILHGNGSAYCYAKLIEHLEEGSVQTMKSKLAFGPWLRRLPPSPENGDLNMEFETQVIRLKNSDKATLAEKLHIPTSYLSLLTKQDHVMIVHRLCHPSYCARAPPSKTSMARTLPAVSTALPFGRNCANHSILV